MGHSVATEAQRAELVARLSRLVAGKDGTLDTPVPGLHLNRLSQPQAPNHVLQQPAFALIAQGEKRLLVSGEHYRYDAFHYLVSSVHLPVQACVTNASAAHPYLGLRLDLDVDMIRTLIRDGVLPQAANADAMRGMQVHPLETNLLDAVLRLLRLLDLPQDIPVLAPMIKREIFYRLLTGAPGSRLRQIALQDSQTERIARAIRHLREHFDQPLRIENLARAVHMSASSLHHHFKAVTAMTPLQFQKHLRLQEARRLMLAGGLDVAATAHRVGYESSSQFSREYRRQYGKAPTQDRDEHPPV